MRRLLELVSSVRVTIALLCAVGALLLVGQAVPQKNVLQRELYEAWRRESPSLVALLEALELTDVYRSPLAWAIWALFFLNLGLVMARRVPGTIRRTRLERGIPDPASAAFPIRRALAVGEATADEVRRWFATRGFAVQVDGARVRAVKNRHAPLATLAFHLSFFLVAAGAWASAVTRFEGTVELGEGEIFAGEVAQYAGRPSIPRFGAPPRAQFLVEAIEPEVEGHVPTRVRIHVRDERGAAHVFEINAPYRAGGASFVFKGLGVAPLLVVTDATGRERFAGFMRLDVLHGKVDAFQLLGQQFSAELFPDHELDAAGERSRSQEMRNPVLRLTVKAASGRTLSRSMRPGGTMELGPYVLTFVDWRYWVKLYVRSERGLWLMWLGFGLGAGALAWRLFLYRREYVVALAPGPDGARLGARAEYFRALFADEAEGVARALEADLGRPPATGRASGGG